MRRSGQLEAARCAWEQGAHREALSSLVSLWREWKVGRLGDVIAGLTQRASVSRAPIRPAASKSAVDVWREVEAAGDELDWPRLLEPMPTATSGVQFARMKQLVEWPPHPVPVRAIVSWWEERERRLVVVTEALIRVVEASEDGALSARLAALAPNLTAAMKSVARSQARALRELAVKAATWVEPTTDGAEDAALTRLEALLHDSTRKPASDDTGALFAKVYASPGDDAIRALVADALVAKGDPRGEFISMQVMRGDGAPTKEEKKLQAEWGDTWLGCLKPCFRKGVVFRRGFPAEGAYEKGGEPSWPQWATFEALDFFPASGFVGGGAAILTQARLPVLRRVTGLGPAVLESFGDAPTLFALDQVPWTTLGLLTTQRFLPVLSELLTTKRFPLVRALQLGVPAGWSKPSDEVVVAALSLPFVSQLSHLEVAAGPAGVKAALATKVETLVLRDERELAHASWRPAEGRLELVIDSVAPQSVELFGLVLDALPVSALKTVALSTPRASRDGTVISSSPYKKCDLAPLLARLEALRGPIVDVPR